MNNIAELPMALNLKPANRDACIAMQRIKRAINGTDIARRSQKDKFNRHSLAVIPNLFRGLRIRYSRDHTGSPLPEMYLSEGLKSRSIIKVVDALIESGLIDHTKGYCDYKKKSGLQSSFTVTALFHEIVDGLQPEFRPVIVNPIVLRDPSSWSFASGKLKKLKGPPLNYQDTSYTRKQRSVLIRYNAFLSKYEVIHRSDTKSSRIYPALNRIFSGDFNHGGRFYADHGGYQQLSSDDRLELLIDGEPVAELDYNALHVRFAYGLSGMDYSKVIGGDPYTIEGVPREVAKLIVIIGINSTSKPRAIASIKRKLTDQGSPWADADIAHIFEQFTAYHSPIAEWFGSGAGRYFQKVDSDLMREILLACMDLEIVALPVHDSIIVPESKSEIAREIMISAFKDSGFGTALVTTQGREERSKEERGRQEEVGKVYSLVSENGFLPKLKRPHTQVKNPETPNKIYQLERHNKHFPSWINGEVITVHKEP